MDLQHPLHPHLLHLHSALLVKLQSTGIARPDVEGHIVAADLLCIGFYKVKQLRSDVLAAAVLIDAEIVDIERLDRCQHMLVGIVKQHTERITEYPSVLLVNEDRTGILRLFDEDAELLIGVLFASCAEQIGSAVVVNGGYLIQKGIDAVKVGNLCKSNAHIYYHDFLEFRPEIRKFWDWFGVHTKSQL